MLDKQAQIKAYRDFYKTEKRFRFLDEEYGILSQEEIDYQNLLEARRMSMTNPLVSYINKIPTSVWWALYLTAFFILIYIL